MDPSAHYAHSFAQVEAKYLEDFMNNPQRAYADHAKYAEGLRKREKEEAEVCGKPSSYSHMQVSSTNHQHKVDPNTLRSPKNKFVGLLVAASSKMMRHCARALGQE